MSRKATCLDNVAMESFFHIMKAETFYQKETDTYETLVSQISAWIDDYNFLRIKIKLGCKSPVLGVHFKLAFFVSIFLAVTPFQSVA